MSKIDDVSDPGRSPRWSTRLLEDVQVLIQRWAPLHLLTRLAGILASSRRPWIAQPMIRRFMKLHGVGLEDALYTDPASYNCFNAFFTRRRRPATGPGRLDQPV